MTRSLPARICKFHLLVVLVFIYILLLPCIWSFQAWRRMRRKRRGWVRSRIPSANSEREHWLRTKNAPHKLPEIRKRELTLPLEDSIKTENAHRIRRRRPQATNPQLQSKLLRKMPPEIRTMIWERVLGGEVLHVVRMHKRLGHTACEQKRRLSITDDISCCNQYQWTAGGDHYRDFPATAKPRKLLALLKTCRMVYTESIDILYSQNTFSFKDLDAFIDLKNTILPIRLQNITSLHIHWNWDNPMSSTRYSTTLYKPYDTATWKSIWDIIAEMKKLQVLKLDLRDTLRTMDAERETGMFEPMKQIKHLREFEVKVGWSESDGVDLSDVPCTIIRPMPMIEFI